MCWMICPSTLRCSLAGREDKKIPNRPLLCLNVTPRPPPYAGYGGCEGYLNAVGGGLRSRSRLGLSDSPTVCRLGVAGASDSDDAMITTVTRWRRGSVSCQ
jgi:hypothetical protein